MNDTGNDKVKIVFFAHIFANIVDRFTSNQDQNIISPFYRAKLHITLNTFHHRKCFIIVSVCLSLPKIPFVHSVLKRHRKFMFHGDHHTILLTLIVNGEIILS